MRVIFLIIVTTALLMPIVADAQTRRRSPQTRRPAPARAGTPAVKPPVVPAPSASVTTPSGLIYMVTHQGTGRRPVAGEQVRVHYTGLLTNGTVFDSSRQRGEPFGFKLGEGRVIKGWDEGIALLNVGDRAVLVIPPQLGYGERGAGNVIPPGATLIFLVELVGIEETTQPAVPPVSPRP